MKLKRNNDTIYCSIRGDDMSDKEKIKNTLSYFFNGLDGVDPD